MPELLDIPEVRQRLSRLSVAEYHRLDEFNEQGRRTELVRGIVIEKMSKSPLHRTISSLLHRMLQAQLPQGFSVWKEEPLTLTHSEPEPDLTVTRGDLRDFKTAHPTTAELVVEVAVSSATLDRENAPLYAEAGVKEYWIVLGVERRVEVYRQPAGGSYREKLDFAEADTLDCLSVTGVRIPLAEIFA